MLYWDEKVRCSVFVGTAGVAPSASMVHFDDGDGDTLRVVAASGRLRTAGATSFCMKMACLRLWGHLGRMNHVAQRNHLHVCPQ